MLVFFVWFSAFATAFVLPVATVLVPRPFGRLMGEDGPVETITAALFLLAAAFLFRAAARSPHRWWHVAAGLVALAAGLSELSFGERIIGFEPPVVMDVRIDAVHDWAQVTHRIVQAVTGGSLVMGLIIAIVVAAAAVVLQRLIAAGAPRDVGFLVGAAAFIAIAMVIDLKLDFLRHPLIKRSYVEETIELTGAILLFTFAARSVLRAVRPMDRGADGRAREGALPPNRT